MELTTDESTAVSNALRSYLSDLRMEIRDTDNPGYKRDLREEREALESAVAKMDEVATSRSRTGHDDGRDDGHDDSRTVTIVQLWWSPAN